MSRMLVCSANFLVNMKNFGQKKTKGGRSGFCQQREATHKQADCKSALLLITYFFAKSTDTSRTFKNAYAIETCNLLYTQTKAIIAVLDCAQKFTNAVVQVAFNGEIIVI